ncbi:MAG: hypothetical protein K2Q22_18210 [Cytophagales bacterium]|nr:hypothetical protein [Cytophagales bacterium]
MMVYKKAFFAGIVSMILWIQPSFGQFKRSNPTLAPNDSVAAPKNPTSSLPVPSAAPKRNNILDRLAIGGNFSLSFGSITFINISPLVGYRATERLMPGAGVTYMYYQVGGYSRHFYGGNIFTRYTVFQNLFVQAELEALHVNTSYRGQDIGVPRWAISPMIGGGYLIKLGNVGGIMASLMYNLNYNANSSIYSGPLVYRLGFIF